MIDPEALDFASTPVSDSRPSVAYLPRDPAAPPSLSLVTPVFAPGAVFDETVASVLGQTLQQWEWILVDDASPDDVSLERLAELEARDPRVRVLRHPSNRGRSAARNTGVAAARSEWVYMLDHDDLLEPTALEKTLWHLHTRPELCFSNGWSAAFGAQELLWTRGFERAAEFLDANQVGGRALLRKSALEAIGGYDERLVEGFEDWDLWLRFAQQGEWGATIPEVLDWFRRRDPPAPWEEPGRAESYRKRFETRYAELYASGFPDLARPRAAHELPPTIENALADGLKRVLVLLRAVESATVGTLLLPALEHLVEQGWELCIAADCTLQGGGGQGFDALSGDVHVMERFLALEDRPRFVEYLVDSRGPACVLTVDDGLGLELAAWLMRSRPKPRYVALSHDDPQGADRDLGVAGPTEASFSLFDTVIASSAARAERLKEALGSAGAARCDWLSPGAGVVSRSARSGSKAHRRERLGVEPGGLMIVVPGRLTNCVRVGVVGLSFRALAKRGVAFRAVVTGVGPRRPWLESFVAHHRLEKHVRFADSSSIADEIEALRVADLCCLPVSQGLPASVLRAMAHGLPVVSSATDALCEVIDESTGVLVPLTDDRHDAAAFAAAMASLADDPERRRLLGRKARRVLSSRMPDALARALETGPPRRRRRKASPGSASLPAARALLDLALVRSEGAARAMRLGYAVRECESRLAELQSWNAELVTGKAWLEEQVAEQQSWIEELEAGRSWSESLTRHWPVAWWKSRKRRP